MSAHPDLALAAVEAWPAVDQLLTEWGIACTRRSAVTVALRVLEAAVAGGHVVTLQAHQDALAKAGGT